MEPFRFSLCNETWDILELKFSRIVLLFLIFNNDFHKTGSLIHVFECISVKIAGGIWRCLVHEKFSMRDVILILKHVYPGI